MLSKKRVYTVIGVAVSLWLTGCGDSGTSANAGANPTPAPVSPAAADKWAAVKMELDNFSVANAALIVGNGTGVRLRYEKGIFKLTDTHLVASASKMMSGLTILKLVDEGRLSLSDNPQKYLTYWTSDPADPRSRITLGQLLAFTSGFNTTDTPSNCVSNATTTLQACAQEFYNQGITTGPGTAFYYSNAHLHIAAAMAEAATGQGFSALYRSKVAVPLAIGTVSGINFPSTSNPRPSGGGTSTGEEYAKMLDGVLAGRLLASNANFINDQTVGVTFGFRPSGTYEYGDWHYAAASWRECDVTPFDASCTARRIISSPGAFGWTPWIDFDKGYYAVIAMEGPSGSNTISIALEQRLQPLIEAALAAGG
jgi:serine-type D-Ala-D-Ala carboxypeptidase/endopeptidase